MSSFWSWFVVIITVGSLVWTLYLLFNNRRVSGNETTGHDFDGIQELDNPLELLGHSCLGNIHRRLRQTPQVARLFPAPKMLHDCAGTP